MLTSAQVKLRMRRTRELVTAVQELSSDSGDWQWSIVVPTTVVLLANLVDPQKQTGMGEKRMAESCLFLRATSLCTGRTGGARDPTRKTLRCFTHA